MIQFCWNFTPYRITGLFLFCSILCHAAENPNFCVYKEVTTRGNSSCITQTEHCVLICQLLHATGVLRAGTHFRRCPANDHEQNCSKNIGVIKTIENNKRRLVSSGKQNLCCLTVWYGRFERNSCLIFRTTNLSTKAARSFETSIKIVT